MLFHNKWKTLHSGLKRAGGKNKILTGFSSLHKNKILICVCFFVAASAWDAVKALSIQKAEWVGPLWAVNDSLRRLSRLRWRCRLSAESGLSGGLAAVSGVFSMMGPIVSECPVHNMNFVYVGHCTNSDLGDVIMLSAGNLGRIQRHVREKLLEVG